MYVSEENYTPVSFSCPPFGLGCRLLGASSHSGIDLGSGTGSMGSEILRISSDVRRLSRSPSSSSVDTTPLRSRGVDSGDAVRVRGRGHGDCGGWPASSECCKDTSSRVSDDRTPIGESVDEFMALEVVRLE